MSDPIRYRAFGAGGPLAQLPRIVEGLVAYGTQEGDKGSCDLVYANDAGSHSEAIAWRGLYAPEAKLILNVLDLPEHLFGVGYTDTDLRQLQSNLLSADAITSISPFTQSQIIRYLGLASTVIWNPVKRVSPEVRLSGARPYAYRVLISGRSLDRNKRITSLAIPALIAAGFEEHEVAVVGGEHPGWGTVLGCVSDGMLNDLLNSVDLVMSVTLCGGLELGPCEAAICGAVPILTYDTSTFHDLGWPQHWGCYPSVPALAYRLRVLIDNPAILEADRQHCLSMSETITARLSGAAVARRLLDVYQRLIKPS